MAGVDIILQMKEERGENEKCERLRNEKDEEMIKMKKWDRLRNETDEEMRQMKKW